ncbi:hypothetical protein AVEN_5222-1 [Araneus ventricosus]|uniref:Uncharacterized protein n=1 Tax=Araneus ventricosus TaxID=182803 RepID=A0A4Y2I349_ARAVE|nr:hypothetical protein AVEN_5222-1 [Araneus ventricosus]
MRQSDRRCIRFWISRLGVIIASYKGSNFDSNLLQALTRFLGTRKRGRPPSILLRMESWKGCIVSTRLPLSVMAPLIGQRSCLLCFWACVPASRRVLEFRLRKWFMASACVFLESLSEIPRHPVRCLQRRPSCRDCDSTQESSGLCALLTICLIIFLCIQIFVFPNTFLYAVILSENRWNSRTKVNLR